MHCNLVPRKVNDQSFFDFTIECQNEKFYVHEMILRDQSEYLEAVLRNDCVESREKKLKIDDFELEVVEILLRHIYNCAVYYKDLDDTSRVISLMKIADKYNFSSLYDAIDSISLRDSTYHLISQWQFFFEKIDKICTIL